MAQPKCLYMLSALHTPSVAPGNWLGKKSETLLVRGTASSHVTHSFYQEMSEEVLLLQGCLGGLEVFPVTALSLPFVNLIGEDKPFLDHCPWFAVLLPYDQNRFLQ